MEAATEHARQQRIELILQQVDALPTLSPIATRLLRLSSAEDADVREIVRLVEADPSLTSRLLSMCRKADRGVSQPVTTVERAVMLLGFDAVRSALLSVHMYELMGEAPGATIDHAGAPDGPADAPDRDGLWRHALGVACAAEELARTRDGGERIRPEEAFVAGLLHDLGKLALDVILPRSYARVARLAERRQANIAQVEREIIGVDHHTAGKRVAEHWGLPHALQDVMWLHNQPGASLPELPHRELIALVTLADGVARRLHIGWSGNYSDPGSLEGLAGDCHVPEEGLRRVQNELHDRLERLTRSLGFEETVGPELRMQSIAAANARLASMNAALESRSRLCSEQSTALAAIGSFQLHSMRGRGVIATFGDVVRSAAGVFGHGFYALVHQTREDAPWQVCQFSADGRLLRSQVLDPPAGSRTLAELADFTELRAGSVGLLPWLEDFLGDAHDIREVRLLPLLCGGGQPALLLHDREIPRSLLRSPAMPALTSVWAGAIAAAAQHDGARRLGERLAEANRVLSETQTRLTEARSMARLGELAAGAAHEMNNPLTVISGRSQLLRTRLSDSELRRGADAIHEASQRLTELITGLHLFADPPKPNVVVTDLTDLLARVVRDVKLQRHSRGLPVATVRLMMEGQSRPIRVDPAQISAACVELLRNAMEARPREIIEIRVEIDEEDDRLLIEFRDDGRGFSEHALAHAFDPFFSEKEAGRQVGLGLAKARRLVELHGGDIELERRRQGGAIARIALPLQLAGREGQAPPMAA